MAWITDVFQQYGPLLVVLSFLINIITIIFIIINMGTTSNLKEKYRKLVRGSDGKQIEGILFDHMDKIESFHQKIDQLESQQGILANKMSFCIQRIGMIRYNAFEDTGSDLSYSIALLDENNNGIIITGIYGRVETVSYAKPIKGGVSNYSLSVEEVQALERAKDNVIDRMELKNNRSNQVG